MNEQTSNPARELTNFLGQLPTASAAGPLNGETRLLTSGLLDSLGILELTTFMSSHFRIEILDEDFTSENFDTIGDLARFIERKQSAR